jgi:MSHA pilin protein MshB
MAKLNRDNQKGFTIVELVVVIIILGILAATALPRFIDVSEDAHGSVVDGVRGALATSVGNGRALWIAGGKAASYSMDGTTLYANTTLGYPRSITAASGSGMVTGECDDLFTKLLGANAPAVIAVADTTGAVKTVVAAAFSAPTDWYGGLNHATPGSATGCSWAYAGRGVATGTTLTVLTYNASTGEITSGTETI